MSLDKKKISRKLITLNIWGGHVERPLLKFINIHREVDIFCFQEVYHNAPDMVSDEMRRVNLNIFNELQALLPNHVGYFRPAVDGIYGIGVFVKKDIEVLGEGEISIHDNPQYVGRGPSHSRNLQWVACRAHQRDYTILNVHGLWNGKGKTDCPERIAQSERIKQFMDTIKQPKILCGDFNLRPDTESMRILETGMANLIKIHQINSTRTRYYPKPEKYADYILISPEITPYRFEVMPEEVSDHAPLFLDFI